ncbi:MAG: transglycosylase SLT domain-containing protein [Anaeromyxobacter sp.]
MPSRKRPAARRRSRRRAPAVRGSLAPASLAPRLARLPPLGWALVVLTLLVALNAVVQVARKPTELLALVAAPEPLPPAQTWDRYGDLCREHATSQVPPEVLAALVQAESSGDALARPPWRWQWSWDPLDWYGPPSSAVGILQITDGTFEEGKRFCVHDHAVARDGAWYDPSSCWFNALYLRTSPGDAIEMTSARMSVILADLCARARRPPTAAERIALVAVIHLCGRERGVAFVARGWRLAPGERCGDQDARVYVQRVQALAALFGRMARQP